MNELDWWLSDQWETQQQPKEEKFHTNRNRTLKRTKLKEFYAIRYADDFKILCRDYHTAQRIFKATEQWLLERLGLEISPEKSKITNVRKGKTDFLGFKIGVKYNKKIRKYTSRSNIAIP